MRYFIVNNTEVWVRRSDMLERCILWENLMANKYKEWHNPEEYSEDSFEDMIKEGDCKEVTEEEAFLELL